MPSILRSIAALALTGLVASSSSSSVFAMPVAAAASSSSPIGISLASSPAGQVLHECTPATFEWTQDHASIEYPLYLRIHTAFPPNETGGLMQAEEEEAVITQAERATWMVDYPAGTVVQISLRDSVGRVGQSQRMTIRQGASQACMMDDDVVDVELQQQAQVVLA